MKTTVSAPATNSYVRLLEGVLAESQHPVEWLIITHNDSRMVQHLSSALSSHSAAIIEASQDTWDREWNRLSEAIEWALQHGDIKNLVLVGHSQPGGAAGRVSLVERVVNEPAQTRGKHERLLAGVKRWNAQNHDAQQRFASYLQAISQLPVVHHHWTNDRLAVYGLYYRAEDGMFLTCDPTAGEFSALIAG